MIVAITKFGLRPGMTRAQHVEEMQKTVNAYRGRPGLVRKYITLDLEKGLGQGIYLWTNRADADRYFDQVRRMIREQVGHEPEITFVDAPLVFDNVTDTLTIE